MSFQQYVSPVERLNNDARHEETTWDGCLTECEMAEEGLASQLQKAGSDLRFWDLPQDDQDWLLDRLEACRSYPQAVGEFLARRKAEAHVEEMMADFGARLEVKP